MSCGTSRRWHEYSESASEQHNITTTTRRLDEGQVFVAWHLAWPSRPSRCKSSRQRHERCKQYQNNTTSRQQHEGWMRAKRLPFGTWYGRVDPRIAKSSENHSSDTSFAKQHQNITTVR